MEKTVTRLAVVADMFAPFWITLHDTRPRTNGHFLTRVWVLQESLEAYRERLGAYKGTGE